MIYVIYIIIYLSYLINKKHDWIIRITVIKYVFVKKYCFVIYYIIIILQG